MNYNIKKIDSEEDKKKTKDLWMSYSKWEGSVIHRSSEDIEKIFNSSDTRIYGSFDSDEKLLSTMTVTIWSRISCYVLNGHCIEKNVMKTYSFKNYNPVTPLVNFILLTMEKNNYFTFYLTQAITPGLQRQHRNGGDIIRNTAAGWDTDKNQYRYNRYIEEIIPSNSRSRHELFNNMIDNKQYQHNIAVIKHSLKPEYRPWPDVLLNGDKYFIKKSSN